MKKILMISGSARADSTNTKLLDAIPFLFSDLEFSRFENLHLLPIFTEIVDQTSYPQIVLDWRKAVEKVDAVIISTPEYIFNLPALIKNGLEWLTASGELVQKKVLPITFMPTSPRGANAMQSLRWSLQGLNAQIVTQLQLYQDEILFDKNGRIVDNENLELLKEAIRLVVN